MRFKGSNKYFKWGLTAFLVIAASISFGYMIFLSNRIKSGIEFVVNLMMPIMFGFIMAYLMTPVLNHIETYWLHPIFKKIKIKNETKKNAMVRGLGILLTICFFVFAVSILIYMLLAQIIPSITNIVSNFDIYINNITTWINELLEDNPAVEQYVLRLIDTYSAEFEIWLNETVLSKTSALIMTVSLSVISVIKVLWNLIIGIIIAIYLMGSKEKFAGHAKKIVYAVCSKDTANKIINNSRFIHKTFIGFVGGKIVDSAIIGILCLIGTSLLKTPYAALVSLIVGVTNIIPFFGPFLGAIPSLILIFVVDPLNPINCLKFVIFVLALQQFDGNILGPKILGESTGLSSFWVIFSITFFGGIWGITGMIIGVPLFAVIYAAIKSLVNSALKKKEMLYETKDYINLGYVDDEGYHEYVPDYKQKKRDRERKKEMKKDLKA